MSEVATTTPAGVPDLYRPPVSAGLDASDIRLPKLKIGQYSTPQVQDGLVKAGDIFSHLTKEDATVIREAKPKVGVEDPLEFFVLGIRKGWSRQNADKELEMFSDDDPRVPELMSSPNKQDRPWRTYSYTVAIPSVDEELPHTLLLSRSSTPAARLINLFIKKFEAQQPGYELPFLLRTKFREDSEASNRWFVAAVDQAPEPANAAERKARQSSIEIVSDLAMIAAAAPAPQISRASSDEGEPSI